MIPERLDSGLLRYLHGQQVPYQAYEKRTDYESIKIAFDDVPFAETKA